MRKTIARTFVVFLLLISSAFAEVRAGDKAWNFDLTPMWRSPAILIRGGVTGPITVAGAAEATFYEVQVSSEGMLSLQPHLTIQADNAQAINVARYGLIAFTPDARTTMWVIADVIQPR